MWSEIIIQRNKNFALMGNNKIKRCRIFKPIENLFNQQNLNSASVVNI